MEFQMNWRARCPLQNCFFLGYAKTDILDISRRVTCRQRRWLRRDQCDDLGSSGRRGADGRSLTI